MSAYKGYWPVRLIIPVGQPNGGRFFDIWQQVDDNGNVVGYCLDDKTPIGIPSVYEMAPRGESVAHFEPNVVSDPNAAEAVMPMDLWFAAYAADQARGDGLPTEQAKAVQDWTTAQSAKVAATTTTTTTTVGG